MNIITTELGWTVYNASGDITGWIRRNTGHRGEHKSCKQALKQGLGFHAIPFGFAVTMQQAHFATLEVAGQALDAIF